MNTSTNSNNALNLTSALELIQKLQAENKQLQEFKSKTYDYVNGKIEYEERSKDYEERYRFNGNIYCVCLKQKLEEIEDEIKNPPREFCGVEDSDDEDFDDDEFVEVNPDDYVNHYDTNKKCKGADYGYKSSPAKIKLAKKNWIIYDKILDLQKYLKDYLTNYEFENQEVLPIRNIVFTVNRVNTEKTASLKTLQDEHKDLQEQYKQLLHWRNEYALDEYKAHGESEWLQEIYGIPKVEHMDSMYAYDWLFKNLDNYYYNCRDAKLKELSTHKIEN